MKSKKITTTDFYKNPSSAISFVKEGGIVYLGYKKLKDPIAVIISANTYQNAKLLKNYKGVVTKTLKQRRLDALQKYKFTSKIWKSSIDFQNEVRE